MKLSFSLAVAVAAMIVAGAASAQTANVNVQQINGADIRSVTNFNRSVSLGNTTVGGTSLANQVSIDSRDINVSGPGWVSATTGIGGMNNGSNVSAATNVDRVAFGANVEVQTQAISNNLEANAGATLNINNTISQRTANADINAQTNVSNILVAGRSEIGAVSVVNNINGSGSVVNVGGTSTADLQISRGVDVVASTNVSNAAFGGRSAITSQAVSNSGSFSGHTLNYSGAQTIGLGDPWPVAQTNTAFANTNVSGALFAARTDIGSTALQNTLSFEGVNVNVTASQSNYGSYTSSLTNVSLSGFGGVTSIGSTSVGNAISVKLP